MTLTLLEWLSLAGICCAGAASPGPSLAVIFGASLSGGRGAGLLAALGHGIGVGLYALLTVLGISALLALNALLFVGIQVAGALYLLWLALRLWRSHSALDGDPADRPPSALAAFRDGFAVAFLNPKLALFMLALFSQFIEPGAPLLNSAVLVATAGGIDWLWYTLVALLFTRPTWLAALRARAVFIDRGFAVLLTLLASYILIRALF